MASKKAGVGVSVGVLSVPKKTSQGHNWVKKSSMNKSKKRSYKKYRGQGK